MGRHWLLGLCFCDNRSSALPPPRATSNRIFCHSSRRVADQLTRGEHDRPPASCLRLSWRVLSSALSKSNTCTDSTSTGPWPRGKPLWPRFAIQQLLSEGRPRWKLSPRGVALPLSDTSPSPAPAGHTLSAGMRKNDFQSERGRASRPHPLTEKKPALLVGCSINMLCASVRGTAISLAIPAICGRRGLRSRFALAARPAGLAASRALPLRRSPGPVSVQPSSSSSPSPRRH